MRTATIGNPILPTDAVLKRIEQINADRFDQIFIPGEVPSKKNSQKIIYHARKPMVISSEYARRYKQQTQVFYAKYRKNFLKMMAGMEFPVHLSFRFYRRTKASWDWINMMQTVQDAMVETNWIPDDSVSFLYPYPQPFVYDPEMFGVLISLHGQQQH